MNSSTSGIGLSSGLDSSTLPLSSDDSSRLPDRAEARKVPGMLEHVLHCPALVSMCKTCLKTGKLLFFSCISGVY